MILLDHVLADPRPTLDEKGSQEQFHTYQEVLKCLLAKMPYVFSIPAGAGSGKTHTLISIIIGLLRHNIPSDLIEGISFTNASADDFQNRLITELVALSKYSNETITVKNLSFSTIHKHAIDLLKKLSPHVPGVNYYFEDAQASTVNSEANNKNNTETAEEEIKQKAVKLALYSSLVFNSNVDMLEALIPFLQKDEIETRFILSGLSTANHKEEAHSFIHEEAMTDSGLGAFTNIDDTNPDYCIAVVTDALLRLHQKTENLHFDQVRQRYGLPKYLLVDESQDLDFIQLLYLRALAINGVSIVMVGDPRQTLYEFRNAVSEWPFDKAFLDALFYGTDVKIKISSSPLQTNYRSRKEIIDLAEALSRAMVLHSNQSISKNINPIYDPKESVKASHCFLSKDEQQNTEKLAKSVNIIIGEKTTDLDILQPINESNGAKQISGPLGLLNKKLLARNQKLHTQNESLKKRLPYLQLPNVCGGKNLLEIKAAIQNLYARVSDPRSQETAAILTRNGQKPEDYRLLSKIISERYPHTEQSNELKFRQINTKKNAPLSEYGFFDSDLNIAEQVPFTSILVGAAIHYFFSWDKKASDNVNIKGGKPLNMIIIQGTKELVVEANKKYKPEQTIKIELEPYFNGLLQSAEKFFPEITITQIEENKDAILSLMARFVYDVVIRYAILLWELFEGKNISLQPCRFNSACTLLNKIRNRPQIRNLHETKRFFKAYWQAVAKTPFLLQIDEQQLLRSIGIKLEWMTVSTSLLNFPEEIAAWVDLQKRQHKELTPEIANRINNFIKDRETIHQQFSNLYHHKTRKYLRHIAKTIGTLIRLDPTGAEDPITTLIAAHDQYRDARQKSRTSTWFAERGNKYMGLIEDMQTGMKDINIQSTPKSPNDDESIPTIDLSTIHSSKGLEWDHVLLIFPSASSKDSKSTFKSVRDLLYVAITRAVRTLTIILPDDKNYKDSSTITGVVAARHLLHEIARKNDYYNREIQYEALAPKKEKQASNIEPKVETQTSHSELEKALTCRLHHYIQHHRNLSSMVPLTAPSYSFFFHSLMSSICAGLVGQRIQIENDPVNKIVNIINSLAKKEALTESDAYQIIMVNLKDELIHLMQSMVPLYFLSGGDKSFSITEYYAHSFASQLSAIVINSRLFEMLIKARNRSDHKVWIEKPIKDVLLSCADEQDYYYPIIGIPDIKIVGEEINYVCDYKTVETVDDETGINTDILNQISAKTATQINLYQGLFNRAEQKSDFLAEVIYVADITLFEGQEIPQSLPILPAFNNNARYRVKGKSNAATVLWTDSFDQSRFEETTQSIANLRFNANDYLKSPDIQTFSNVPLVGEYAGEQISCDTCSHCPSAIHCQKFQIEG